MHNTVQPTSNCLKPPTCLDFARQQLEHRAISPTTVKNYLQSVRVLDLADLPVTDLTAQLVTSRLRSVLTASTRRKHAVNIQAVFGIKVKKPALQQKAYDLPSLEVLRDALTGTRFEMHGLAMLYAGLRIGEACVNQSLSGTTLMVDRQRGDNSSVTAAKSAGPVLVQDWFADAYKSFDFDQHPTPVYRNIKKVLRRVSTTPLTPHALRHAFATNLVKAGATPEMLRRQMRHSDITLALRYYVHTTDAEVMAVMAGFGKSGVTMSGGDIE